MIAGALKDECKVVLAVASGQRESKESWAGVLRDLRDRGLRPWQVTVADGHPGIWAPRCEVGLGEVRGWGSSPGTAPDAARRLISFTHLLT
ncbi:MAG: hypothetical protein KatS3mg077_1318 [Candidatus Binatia bacterium]|nr:MAG: hypothetical protein KatS3mg077_1318 [Candidatus Binatia bacterium]